MKAKENEFRVLGTKAGEGFSNKCHFQSLVVSELRNLIQWIHHISRHSWFVSKDVTKGSLLSLFYVCLSSHSLTILTCLYDFPIPDLSCREYFIPVSNQGRSPWRTSDEFWIPWGATSDYCCSSLSITEHLQCHYCHFHYYVIAVGSVKLTRNGTEKSWKGTSAFLMYLTPVVIRTVTAFISILLGDVESEWLFRNSFSTQEHNRI